MNLDRFMQVMDGYAFEGGEPLAVAVSGGPDSMALCHVLHDWCVREDRVLHALIVDHGLRDESADEAKGVIKELPEAVIGKILKWDAPKNVRVQEEARNARYALMAHYCAAHDIQHLFLGHHRDDQAETVLFRLAKGSGLDGLCGMRPVQNYDENLKLLRPFLEFEKSDLLEYCEKNEIQYVQDPSNENEKFARVRLRQSREILEEEGLSAKRLSLTAKRLNRARNALDQISENEYKNSLFKKDTKQIVLNFKSLQNNPDEIILRVILRAVADLQPEQDYAPRMERVESILYDLISFQNDSVAFRKRTLGGVIFEIDAAGDHFILRLEK